MSEAEPGSAYLAAMREQWDRSARFHAELHQRYCRGRGCRWCDPVERDRERLIDEARD